MMYRGTTKEGKVVEFDHSAGPAGKLQPLAKGANMSRITFFLPDVNDELAYREATEDAWEREPGPDYIPAKFVRLICDGVDPEVAADLADDGLPVCSDDPPEFADDGELVVAWPTMSEEVA